MCVQRLLGGFRDLGYTEGHNLLLEPRSAEGRPERLRALAAELVRLGVDVIVTAVKRGGPGGQARDHDDPDRHGGVVQPRPGWPRHQPGAAGRQPHRADHRLRLRYRRETAPVAQGGRTDHLPCRCPLQGSPLAAVVGPAVLGPVQGVGRRRTVAAGDRSFPWSSKRRTSCPQSLPRSPTSVWMRSPWTRTPCSWLRDR